MTKDKITKDKVIGTLMGAFIGDSMGSVCEGFSQEKIKKTYGRITTLLVPERSWNKDRKIKAGTPTDDWQLTKAVAEALIHSGKLDMKSQAKFHVKALEESTNGWGRSTRDSVIRLQAGIHWKKSGQPLGSGCGVAMKFAPLAAISATNLYKLKKYKKFAINLAHMTHRTSLAATSGYIHMLTVRNLLLTKKLHTRHFLENIYNNSRKAEHECKKIKTDTITDKLSNRLIRLFYHEQYDTDRIIEEFGAGSCYVYNSLPFAYMFFIKNPNSIESLYDVINAGGDTDSNGSIVASMLGALHGASVFPRELIESIPKEYYEEVMDVADRFADKFGFN